MKKSRFLYLHPEANAGKICALESLQGAYTTYLKVCVDSMISARRFKVLLSEKQSFFPPCQNLSSQIVKNVRDHAIGIVSGWAASKYTTTLRDHIRKLFREGKIDEPTRAALCIIGKKLVNEPKGRITQEALDFYWTWLLDEELVGRVPTISSRCGMRMSEMTAVFAQSEDTRLTAWWIGFSHLRACKPRIQLPLSANPYVKNVNQVSKGVLARKDKRGRWSFEVVDKKDWLILESEPDIPRVGVDVGLNVVAATSEGRTFGADLKPKFDRLYNKVRSVRSNRQRQGLKENSQRLDRLEDRLTRLTKSVTGRVSNELLRAYPDSVFVLEDLDLSGCKGQKRFCYRALANALESKTPIEKVNPAYSSQTCPSCGHVSRSNRNGTTFVCRQCGRRCHADVVGGINLLRRSETKQVGSVKITCDNHLLEVKEMLVRLYWARRNPGQDCPQGFLRRYAPLPHGRRLTTRGSGMSDAGIASNQVQDRAT
jgi:putative transposase